TFFTPCTAGSLFGVIQSDGTVYPCEILDKPLGDLRDYDFDFLKLWFDRPAREITTWIRQTKCNCHWECHYTYNIISSFTYSVKLALKMLSLKLFR
ncbi:MAG: SPASM domain-containing protein, partial [bacterium]|nr:SPASM domain-containing protein [bacterium]